MLIPVLTPVIIRVLVTMLALPSASFFLND